MNKKIRIWAFILSLSLVCVLVGWKISYASPALNNFGTWLFLAFLTLVLFTLVDAFTQPKIIKSGENKTRHPALTLLIVLFKIGLCLFAIIGVLASIYLLLVYTPLLLMSLS